MCVLRDAPPAWPRALLSMRKVIDGIEKKSSSRGACASGRLEGRRALIQPPPERFSNAADDPPIEACLAALLDHLGIASAHFAGRGSADLQGFMARYPERVASLTLLCP